MIFPRSFTVWIARPTSTESENGTRLLHFLEVAVITLAHHSQTHRSLLLQFHSKNPSSSCRSVSSPFSTVCPLVALLAGTFSPSPATSGLTRYRITSAGTLPTIVNAGTSLATTALAATVQPLPIVTPIRTLTAIPS